MKDLKKYFIIHSTPDAVYRALVNPATIQLWSGSEAVMNEVPGSEFSLWEGNICGKNLEFEENSKIVQQWYFEGEEPPSIVTIRLHPHQAGTSVELRHTNIPDEAFDNISMGWEENYFGALAEFYL